MDMGSENLGYASGSDDVLNGIKFGEKIYFENMGSVVKCYPGAPAIPAPSTEKDRSSPKKRRGVTLPSQPPRCQVEGCNVDLTGLKTYYCRHRVCGIHSKFPKVIVGGLEQRFCQQCSRFHLLAEFDQGKRSCRRRLAGHNERRRKPHSSSFVSQTFARVASILNDDVSRMRGFWDYPYSRFPGQSVWHKSIQVDHGIGSENTSEEKFQASMWQESFNSSTKAASSSIPQPDFPRTLDWISLPASDGPASECSALPVSTSRGALSLLSTELHSRKKLSFGLSANTDTMSNSWSFRNHESEVSSDDLAIRQLPSTRNSNCFQMNWSL